MYCLLDMDGVLCNFYDHWYDLKQIAYPKLVHPNVNYPGVWPHWHLTYLTGLTETQIYEDLTTHWWETMPWMPDGEAILTLLEQRFGTNNIFICTSDHVHDSASAAAGKIRWIKKHIPAYSGRYCIVRKKELLANNGALLVDDNLDNCRQFILHGGSAIIVPRPWNDNTAKALDILPQSLSMVSQLFPSSNRVGRY